jgi:hypothetical protein
MKFRINCGINSSPTTKYENQQKLTEQEFFSKIKECNNKNNTYRTTRVKEKKIETILIIIKIQHSNINNVKRLYMDF